MKLSLCFIALLALLSCQTRKPTTAIVIDSLASPATGTAGQPYFNVDAAGTPYLSWQQVDDDHSCLLLSAWKNGTWSPADTLAAGPNWFVNWADFPSFAFHGNNLIANYLERSSDEKFSYDVKLSVFDGQRYSSGEKLHHDSTLTEHGFVSWQPWQDGYVVTWLDGRNTEGSEDHESHGGHHGSMSLRAARLDIKGKVLDEWEIDHQTCDCCQTSMVVTDEGPVIAYRDRSRDEVRDMSLVRWTGDGWSEPYSPYSDGWQIKGCPVNGPRLAARGNRLAMVWFNAANDSTRLQIGFSTDGGVQFGKSTLLNSASTIGRADVVWVDDHRVMVSWIQSGHLVISLVDTQGVAQPPIIAGSISDARGSGFPRMVRAGDNVYLAWTDADRNQLVVRKLTLADQP
ncbi:MAG TPA: exo-alpha-sialidase [Cyclobacteriaceae bacterium]|nr:exo-alpha-sialidase [Cyclobacteriaceae bacterium]